MAALLFNSIDQFKTCVGGSVSNSLGIDSIAAAVHHAARLHIIPWLGEAFWNELVAAYPGSGSPPAHYIYVQRPLAYLAVYEYQPTGALQFNEAGLFRTENENVKTPYKYQEREYREQMREMGFEALEEMVKYFQGAADGSTHTTYFNSTEYTRARQLFVNYAGEMRLYYSKQVSRYTFEVLRATMEDVEAFAIQAYLPAQFYTYLKGKAIAANGTAKEKEAIELVRRAVCAFTIEEAIRKNVVTVKGNSIYQQEVSLDGAYTGEKQLPANQLGFSIRQADLWANRHISHLRSLLVANKASYPLCFATTDSGTNTDADAWDTIAEAEAAALLAEPSMSDGRQRAVVAL